MRDTIYRGVAGGALGTVGDSVVHLIGYLVFGASTTVHLISTLIFPGQDLTLLKFFFSFLVHVIAGSLIGLLLTLIFYQFGHNHPFFKGIGLGVVFWVVHVLVIPNLVAPTLDVYRTETEVAVDLVSHSMYGLIVALYLKNNISN